MARPHMLIAYDANGDVVGTLSHLVARDADGKVTGLVDFADHEAAGGEMTDVWSVSDAVGSKVWPEWIGGASHGFRVELEGPAGRKHIAALVHKASGQRRERATIEANIALRVAVYDPEPADIRDVVGGPDRPLLLDDTGRVNIKAPAVRPNLPLVGVTKP